MLVESLKVFCDLVETQSFSKAAALNSVTQSAVSQQLKSIEKRHGSQLLEREKRRLSLTAEGEIFYRYSREIVRRYEEMQHRIQAMGGVVSGTVRLSSIYSVGMLELAPYAKTYLKTYPKVHLKLEYNQAAKIYEDVASGEIDLGIVAYPRTQRNVDLLQFSEHEMVVICHPSSPLAARKTVAPKDLEALSLILFSSETPTRQAIDRYFRKHRVHPNIAMELDHIATIKNAVEVDLGISIVPSPSVEQEESWETLKVLRLEGQPFLRPLGVLFRKGRSLSAATQRLIETLTQGEPNPHSTSPGRKSP